MTHNCFVGLAQVSQGPHIGMNALDNAATQPDPWYVFFSSQIWGDSNEEQESWLRFNSFRPRFKTFAKLGLIQITLKNHFIKSYQHLKNVLSSPRAFFLFLLGLRISNDAQFDCTIEHHFHVKVSKVKMCCGSSSIWRRFSRVIKPAHEQRLISTGSMK